MLIDIKPNFDDFLQNRSISDIIITLSFVISFKAFENALKTPSSRLHKNLVLG